MAEMVNGWRTEVLSLLKGGTLPQDSKDRILIEMLYEIYQKTEESLDATRKNRACINNIADEIAEHPSISKMFKTQPGKTTAIIVGLWSVLHVIVEHTPNAIGLLLKSLF